MSVRVNEKRSVTTALESQTLPTGRARAEAQSQSSLETMIAAPGDGFRSRPNTLYNRIVKWILNVIDAFLISIKRRPKPTEYGTEITGDAVYDTLDKLIKKPVQFLKAFGYEPLAGQNLNDINLKGADFSQMPLIITLCTREGSDLYIIDQGHFKVTPKVIAYVLKTAPGIDLKAKDNTSSTILHWVKSLETLKLILNRIPQLIDVQNKYGRTALAKHVETVHYYPEQVEEKRKIVQYLLAQGANLQSRETIYGNSLLHECKDRIVAELILEKDPTLVFALNMRYEMPVDKAEGDLKAYLTQFAETHQDLGPKDPNKLLEIAVGQAYSHENSLQNLLLNPGSADIGPFIRRVRELILAGASVATPVRMHDETRSVLEVIVSSSDKDLWRGLLPLAIQKATQDQIIVALIYAVSKAIEYDGQPQEAYWIEQGARSLVAAFKAPPGNLNIKGKTLREWDKEKNWGLYRV